MSIHFVYLWYDKKRKMFYVGKHSGNLNDGYISSNKWLKGEVNYRPGDFKRRIIKIFDTENEAQRYEGKLLACIKQHEWGRKYYNTKQGKPKGTSPWNKGLIGAISESTRTAISLSRKGKPTTKGRPNPMAAENARKGATKLSLRAKGRRRVIRNGKTTWSYPNDVDYPST